MVKYSPTPYSLTKKGIEAICSILEEQKIKEILEFGSGRSTDYLSDLGYTVFSFDDDLNYASSNKNTNVVDLIQLNDKTFKEVIQEKVDFVSAIKDLPPVIGRSSKQKNCFYRLETSDLAKKFNFFIIDGPNGNGRSLAFPIIKKIAKKNSFIFVDDYFHYPFIENLKKVFPLAIEICTVREGNIKGYAIYKIGIDG